MALSDRVVVMQAGRVLQIGTPEAIYQRPQSRAVATFFGSPNLLPATVTSCARVADSEFELSVRGTNWLGICRAGQAMTEGSDVFVMVRPENVHLTDRQGAGNGSAPALSGRVVEKSFHGARRMVTVDVSGSLMKAEVPAVAPLSDEVTLTFDDRAAWALAS
jgi:iron(III) transport system ATP-binding protein